MRHLQEGFKAALKNIYTQPGLKDSYFGIRFLEVFSPEITTFRRLTKTINCATM
jgi:hypothetical protein